LEQFLASVLVGVLFGAPYALLAVGIVLVYKGSRVFNFAQAEFGTVAAFAAFLFADHMPIALAMVLGVVVGVGMGLAVERLVVQPLFGAPRVTVLVATAAVATGSIAVQVAIGGATIRSYPQVIRGNAFVLFSVGVEWQRLLVLLALGGMAFALYIFFSRTALGLAVLAASQEPVATDLVGIGTRRMSALVWGMAGFAGAVTGVLVAGLEALTPGLVTQEYLVFAFVGAVIGGMTSLPGAVVGGLVLGLLQSFSANYLADIGWVGENVPSVSEVVVFGALLIVLALRPAGLLGKEA
jgi:branched-chain amino acid transport system permease protein